MKFSINWLSEYVSLPKIDVLRSKLEQHSFEVEGIESRGADIDEKIITAQVVSWNPHPNADRLRVVTLKTNRQTIAPVVCGASNFDAGDKVCLALPGAVIPHSQHDSDGKSFILQKATIRGVESQGMICSGFELGLNEDSNGILVLPKSARLGEPVAKFLTDTLIDINVQATNRADVQSYRGLAWEIAAITGKKYKASPIKTLKPSASPPVRLRIDDKKACPRYMGALLTNVKIGPSPSWLTLKLGANGIRPVNNVVDITNYVMLEIGLPIHAFDANNLRSIVVRKSRPGEKMVTLIDEEAVIIPKDSLLITEDGDKPIALAGIVGSRGERAVKDNTTTVFMEAAKFDPLVIRAASRALGIRTDASARFEKNLSIFLLPWALSRAVELMRDLAGANLAAVIDNFPAKSTLGKPVSLRFNLTEVGRLLGSDLSFTQVKSALTGSGFGVNKRGGALAVKVPPWRTDIALPEDVIEEIGRLYGYAKIPNKPMSLLAEIKIKKDLVTANKRLIEDSLVSSGFWQTKNYSFVFDNTAERLGFDAESLIELANPLDNTQRFLRPSLLPSLFAAAVRNFRKYAKAINYFEIGNVFKNTNKGLVEQTQMAAVSVAADEPESLVRLVRGALTNLAVQLNLTDLQLRPDKIEPYSKADNLAAQILINGERVGAIGLLSPSVAEHFALRGGFAAYFVLDDLEKVLSYKKAFKYNPPWRFPSKRVDLSFVFPKQSKWIEVSDIINQVNKATGGFITDIDVLEVYRDEQRIGKDKKSLTIRLIFKHPQRTLRDEEVLEITEKLKQDLKSKMGAVVR